MQKNTKKNNKNLECYLITSILLYKMRKIKDQNFYRVVNKDTGKILAKKTTDKNGKKMIKLLNYVDAKKYKKK